MGGLQHSISKLTTRFQPAFGHQLHSRLQLPRKRNLLETSLKLRCQYRLYQIRLLPAACCQALMPQSKNPAKLCRDSYGSGSSDTIYRHSCSSWGVLLRREPFELS